MRYLSLCVIYDSIVRGNYIRVLYRGSVDRSNMVHLPSCFGIHRNYDPNVHNGCKMLVSFNITYSGKNNKDN
jgi:hypothetical protein